ncbi:MAG: NAD(+)/NADH kinase [Muribaculaceae bacterium]|nr:NAD(+)/NADH kinase [Muribaculaceae bacterium]
MRIAINGNRHQEGHLEDIDRLVSALLRRGDTVVMTDRFLNYLEDVIGGRFALGIESVPLSQAPRADMALSIGGDGAFLKTAAWVGEGEEPVAGINTGHLGYLAAFSFDRPQEIEDMLNGKYMVERRSVMKVEAPDCAGPKTFLALNEAAFSRADNASMVTLTVTVGGAAPLTYLGDGLIVSTPTGSTAYNLSVGGPILDPSLPGWVISPVASHSLSVRPLVVADCNPVEVVGESRARTFRVTIDGRVMSFNVGQKIRITKAAHTVGIVYAPGHSFTQALSTKLGLGK